MAKLFRLEFAGHPIQNTSKMTGTSLYAFVAIMLALAALPSASVALVVTRSVTKGFRNGAAVAAGIVCGDILFAILAIVGMAALTESAGMYFSILRYVAAGYLVFLGVSLIRARTEAQGVSSKSQQANLLFSFLSGLFLTLGDFKAILFYASIFPVLFDLRSFTFWNYGVVIALTILTVGGVKIFYAAIARRLAARFFDNKLSHVFKAIVGLLIIAAGIAVVAKS